MRILEWFFKIISSLLLLIIPFILLYWALNIIDLAPLHSLVEILQKLLEPVLFIFRKILGSRVIFIQEFEIDLVPLAACFVILVASIALAMIAKTINVFRNSVSFVAAKTKVHMAQKQRHEEQKEEEKRLFEKSIGFVAVKYKPQTTSSAYLTSSGLSQEDVKNLFKDLLNKYSYFDAELRKESTEDAFYMVFEDVPASLLYSLNLQENINKLNKDLDRSGVKLHVTVGVYCASPSYPRAEAIQITGKICNLANPGEVTCTKDVKQIFEKDRSDHNLRYISRGMYDLGQEIEIFALEKIAA